MRLVAIIADGWTMARGRMDAWAEGESGRGLYLGAHFFFGVDFATSTGDVYIDNLRLTH
jgi:hypothetical protein